jgi:hypothetical protein
MQRFTGFPLWEIKFEAELGIFGMGGLYFQPIVSLNPGPGFDD